MLKLSFFLAAGSVVLSQAGCDVRRCDLRKCNILHKELTTCVGAVMDNYGTLVIFYKNFNSKIFKEAIDFDKNVNLF